MVKDSRLSDKKRLKLLKAFIAEGLKVPVDVVVAKRKRKDENVLFRERLL